MTLTSKQRAFLRAMAVNLDTILMIGKGGISDDVLTQADGALTARELIKGRVLETAPGSVKELAAQVAEATGAELVTTIGTRFVLYRRNEKKPVIELPKAAKTSAGDQ